MNIYKPFEDNIPRNGVATLGFFDGVHKGHAAILNKVKSDAEAYGATPLVATLWPHPRIVLGKNAQDLRLLTTLEEKTALIAKQGLEHFAVIPFDRQLAEQSPESFFRNYFVEWLGIRKLIVGYDHHIGKGGSGDFNAMTKLGDKYGIEVEKVDALTDCGVQISSTKIRNVLLQGNVSMAHCMLGYPYFLSGIVESGSKIGRSIGFPTANISVNDTYKLIPSNGVYAITVTIDGIEYKGMLNIGFRPTVSKEKHKTIEANIFGFDKNIYGRQISIAFIARIRDEVKFDSTDALKRQIEEDKLAALKLMNDINNHA